MPAKAKPIKAENKELELLLYFRSGKDAATYTGSDPSVIAKVCKGALDSSKGWIYSFVEDDSSLNFVTTEELANPPLFESKKVAWNKGINNKISVKCSHCGKEKLIFKSALESHKSLKFYCNKACEYEDSRERLKCPNCGSHFTSTKHKEQTFCSNECKIKTWREAGLKVQKEKYTKEIRSVVSKKIWKDNRDFILERMRSEENRKLIGSKTSERFKDPVFREKHSEAIKAIMTPEHKEILSKSAINSRFKKS